MAFELTILKLEMTYSSRISSISYPGVFIVEGLAADVDEFVWRIKVGASRNSSKPLLTTFSLATELEGAASSMRAGRTCAHCAARDQTGV